MSDIWISTTLGSVLPVAQSAADAITAQIAVLQGKINALQATLLARGAALTGLGSLTNGLLDALVASGFYALPLTAGSGNLVTRISGAGGAIPGGNYSGGLVIGISAADLLAAEAQYTQLITALTAPITVPVG